MLIVISQKNDAFANLIFFLSFLLLFLLVVEQKCNRFLSHLKNLVDGEF